MRVPPIRHDIVRYHSFFLSPDLPKQFRFGFLAIADINYLKGDVGFLFTPEFNRFVKLLGVDISRGFNSAVFMSIILRISFVVLILNTFAKWAMSSVFHKQINLLRVTFLQGTILITVLGLMALSSCFAPQAIPGSETIASFVVFQWFIAMISFTGSILWSYLSGKLFSIFDKN